MVQEFSDLGIEIDDFLADLTKIRNVKKMSFEIFNKYIKSKSQEKTILSTTTEAQEKTITSEAPSKLESIPSTPTNSNSPYGKQQTPSAVYHTIPSKEKSKSPSNLAKRFVAVSEESVSHPSLVTDKPIRLKNQET
jgi:hypothetical protein